MVDKDKLSKYDAPSAREVRGQEFIAKASRGNRRWRARQPPDWLLKKVVWATEDLEFAAAMNAGRDEPLVIVRLTGPHPLFGFKRNLEVEQAAWRRRPERPPGYDESLEELKSTIRAGRKALLEAVSV